MMVGDKEIQAYIHTNIMSSIVKNLKKADMFEKAIEILNEMKDIQEKVLFNYDSVSGILI